MKNYFFLQILIVIGFVNTLKSMDDEQKPQKPFSLCRQILTIDPNAPAADYKALAQRLHDAKLSTCECATYLAQEKKQKALVALKNRNLLSEQDLKKVIKVHKKIDQMNVQNNPVDIYISSNLSDKHRNEITQYFSRRYSITYIPQNTPISFNASAATILNQQYSDFKKKFLKSGIKNYELELFITDFKKAHFIFLHEDYHLISKDRLKKEFLDRKIRKRTNTPLLSWPSWISHFNKFSRAVETQADIIPTACGSCDDAYSAIEFFRDLPHDDRKHDFGHPSHRTRYQRARRIYHLKLAEEELKQKEEPQIL